MKPLIEGGYVYLAKPPLYKVTKRKNERYIDSDEQLDRYLIQLGYEDIKVSWASNGEFLTYDDIHKITGFVERGQKITQGLHRHGVDPSRYFTMERNGEFPTKLIIVHENDGSATESYIYNPEEEANCIAEAEKRLPAIQLPENADPDAPKPLHPAIDIINLYEARDCAE
jgi:DNA gyrase subunit B